MRTPHDDLISDIRSHIYFELNDGSLSEEEEEVVVKNLTQSILSSCWKYIEEYKIDHNDRLIFEYGMLKHLFQGSASE